MARIIDLKGLLGDKFNERKRQRKNDQLWNDLETMSKDEFSKRHNVISAGQRMDFNPEDIEEEEARLSDTEEIKQLTDEDFMWI